MAFYLVVLACLTSLLAKVQADLQADQVCFYACQKTFTNITFSTYTQTDDYYTGYCEDDLLLLSTFLCSKTYCPSNLIAPGLTFVTERCNANTNVDIPDYDTLQANTSHISLDSVRVFEMGEIDSTVIVDTIMLPSRALFNDSYQLRVSYFILVLR